MFCMQCGQQLPDDARFCSACGAPTVVATNYSQQPVQQVQQPQPAPQPQPVYQSAPVYAAQTGALRKEAGGVSSYAGDKAIGTITGTGDLFIYDNRIEYHKKSGSQTGYMLGPVVGAVLSKRDAKKNPVDTYPFNQLRAVRTGKYAGMKKTLVLELSNGKCISFVPLFEKSKSR